MSALELDQENEELHHKTVDKVIQQTRQAKCMTQKDLSTKMNEKPQVVNEYEARAISNQHYNMLSERFRKSTPCDIQCAMFCGGRKCKYESTANWSPADIALSGIFSHWVTEDILAMARPNQEMIVHHNLINSFKEFGIKTVINLEEHGEHASCGNPLNASGFSYDPSSFMDNDIYFYNFQWKDYSTVPNAVLLDMVKVMTFALTKGKVAVHCHAGLGRAGVLIASYLVYTWRCRPQDAIHFVRSKRPNSIQMRSQIESVFQFAQFVVPLFVLYPHIVPKHYGLSLAQHLKRQEYLLHGYEARHLRLIPKVLYVICERLLQLCNRSQTLTPGLMRNTSIDTSETTLIDFQLSNSESFCKYFFAAAKSSAETPAGSRPQSNMTIQLSSGFASPDTALTDLSIGSGSSRRCGTGDSKKSNSVQHNQFQQQQMLYGNESTEATISAATSLFSIDHSDTANSELASTPTNDEQNFHHQIISNSNNIKNRGNSSQLSLSGVQSRGGASSLSSSNASIIALPPSSSLSSPSESFSTVTMSSLPSLTPSYHHHHASSIFVNSLPPVEELSDTNSSLFPDINSTTDTMNGPLRQIGLVGLDTPKRTPNSSGGSGISHFLDDRGGCDADGDQCGNRSDPNSPCDSLTSLIEKTLGYRIMQVPSPPVVYNQLDGPQQQPQHNSGELSDSSDSFTNFEEVLARSGLIPPDMCQDFDENSFEGHQPTAQYYQDYYDDDSDAQHQQVDPILIMSGLLTDYQMHTPEFLKLLHQYQRDLNNVGYGKLSHENNIELLCALLWSWLENLKEPIFNRQALTYIVLKAEKPVDALIKLEMGARYTCEYLIRFIARLKPETNELVELLIKRLIAALAHQCVKINGTLMPGNSTWSEMRKGTTGRVILFLNGLYTILQRS